MKEIAENIVIGKAPRFRMMTMELFGLGKDYVCLRIRLYERQFFMRHMSLLTLFILGVLRCI